MKGLSLFLVVATVLLAFVGVVVAAEMSGVVTAVDTQKNTLTLKSQTMEAPIDCEVGSMLKDVKVGDQLTVEYKEVGGKKVATKITPMMKKKPAVGC
jgi:hypothetical protein